MNETCVDVVRNFLTSVMHVPGAKDFYIPVAHRLGNKRSGHTRSIIAKFPIAIELSTVLRHGNRLRDTRHYVHRQLPPAVTERKNFALDEFKEKKRDVANNAKLINEKLFIKGKYQSKYQSRTLPGLKMDRSDGEPDISTSNDISDSGSIFTSYTAMSANLDDANDVVNAVIQKPGVSAASHVMYAYRLQDARGVITENFDSDDDHGLGLEILKTLRSGNVVNTVCVTTRTCKPGYDHLNEKRYKYVRDTATEALGKM